VIALAESSGEAVHQALVTMYDQFAHFQNEAVSGRERILAEFSWEKHAGRYRTALDALIRKTPR
jgi:outer membrane biogenesis lipoprotein LolB